MVEIHIEKGKLSLDDEVGRVKHQIKIDGDIVNMRLFIKISERVWRELVKLIVFAEVEDSKNGRKSWKVIKDVGHRVILKVTTLD